MFGSYRFSHDFTHFHMQIQCKKHPRCIQTRPRPALKGPGSRNQGLGTRGRKKKSHNIFPINPTSWWIDAHGRLATRAACSASSAATSASASCRASLSDAPAATFSWATGAGACRTCNGGNPLKTENIYGNIYMGNILFMLIL